jgi:hypothetical protein
MTGVFWGMEVADERHDTIGRRELLTGTEVFPMRHSMRPRRSMPSASARHLALACVVAAAAMTASPALAEDEFEFKLLRPTVSVSALAEPNADFKDADGQFRANNFTLGANIPLGGVHIHTQGDLVAHQFLLTALAGTGSQTIDSPALELTPRLYTGLLAGSILFGTRKGNLYYGSLGASFAEEDDAEGGPQARPYGLFLGSFRNSHGVMFTYGAAFTYLFGRGLLLPAFGVVWSPNPTWTISGFLPFSWRFTQKLNDKFRMNYLLNAAGQQYRFANDGNFPGEDSTVYESMKESHIGAEIEYRPSHDVALLGQAGFAIARRLSFADAGEDHFAVSDINAAPYIKLTARFAIGKSVIDQLGGSAAGLAP